MSESIDLMGKKITCEELYNKIDDPWKQTTLKNEIKYLVLFLINNLSNNLSLLEIGSGLGIILDCIRNSNKNFNLIGSDISETAIRKCKDKCTDYHVIDIINDKDFKKIIEINPDIIFIKDVTWYILDKLDNVKKNLKTNMKGKYMIHILNIYENQKYGKEYFTNHQEILNFFDMDYIIEGTIKDKDWKISYFLAKII